MGPSMSIIPGSVKPVSPRATTSGSDGADASFGGALLLDTNLTANGSFGSGHFAPALDLAQVPGAAPTPDLTHASDQSDAGPAVIDSGPTGAIVPASETVTLAGSQLVFVNTYLSGVTDAYRTAVLFAEH